MVKKRYPNQKANRPPIKSRKLSTDSNALSANPWAWIVIPLMLFITFLVYSNSLDSPFMFDDETSIQNNPRIRLTGFSIEDVRQLFGGNRRVAHLSFALNYYFHETDVFGYHLVNILIHSAAGAFLYFFVKTTLCGGLHKDGNCHFESHPFFSESNNRSLLPFFTAMLWLVHPIQTQSVTYIVQRMTSLASMFYILSMLLYAKARVAGVKKVKLILFAGCIISGLLAMGSKPIAATLPIFIFLYEWCFFQGFRVSWLKRHLYPLVAVIVVLVVASLMFLGRHPLDSILAGYGDYDFTMQQRLLTEFRVVIFYIGLLLFPHPSRLNLEHDFPLSDSLRDPITTLLSAGVVAGLVALACYLAFTRKEYLLSFCILWFLGNLVIESSVIALDIIFEHRLYLPSMMFSLLAVTLVCRYVGPEWVKLGVLCTAVIVFALWTYERNKAWSSKITLWSDCVNKSPGKARPHSNLGRALAEKGRADEGVAYLKRALQIDPDYAVAHNNLGTVREQQHRYEEAVAHFTKAVRILPGFSNAHYNLGVAQHRLGRINEAAVHYTETLRIKPGHALAHNNLGVVLEKRGNLDEAISHYTEALHFMPDYPDARRNQERIRRRTGGTLKHKE